MAISIRQTTGQSQEMRFHNNTENARAQMAVPEMQRIQELGIVSRNNGAAMQTY
ncbi:hypothetical protein RFM41_15020 [Mesorhizobium sp. VK25A]|uniref:Uncharacterized protein n=1 Tax=Mesorhizobium vachelliae TaxID=3072309 RepID=A0ABU5A9E1_9HYPH|nr:MULTISPECIES: hypothetical protein [unclassified Mesorhizobium]MDX8533139.1 hypothetical protein [Mesorhizobium sp. VK25D]MDX8545058.1 hypothetical protein [Mesorhizobium sp. VK25A]